MGKSERVRKLKKILKRAGLDALIISQGENRRYLSGFKAQDLQLNEPSGFLILGAFPPILATDPRYGEEAREQAQGFDFLIYRGGFFQDLARVLKRLGAKQVGFESGHLIFAFFEQIKKALAGTFPGCTLIPTRGLVEKLRAVKDEEEIASLEKALSITESVFARIKKELRTGVTEKFLAWRIQELARAMGGEDLSFPPIVASGPRSALPHAEPTDRILKKGDPVLFDLGVSFAGYRADLSRTLFLGKPDDTFRKIYQIVREAQETAEKGIRAGMTGAAADALARKVIKREGFGLQFGHALGHGVGLAAHEAPSLSSRNSKKLKENMVVTIEPGIYLPGWGGVRLENMGVIQKNGLLKMQSERPHYP